MCSGASFEELTVAVRVFAGVRGPPQRAYRLDAGLRGRGDFSMDQKYGGFDAWSGMGDPEDETTHEGRGFIDGDDGSGNLAGDRCPGRRGGNGGDAR